MKLKHIIQEIINENVINTEHDGEFKIVYEKNPSDKPFIDYKLSILNSVGKNLISAWLEKIDSDEIYLEYIGVSDNVAKNNGLGSRLMLKIISFCKSKGFSKLTLRMDEGMGCSSSDQENLKNSKLYRFYSRFGFDFSWTQDEVDDDDEKNACSLELKL